MVSRHLLPTLVILDPLLTISLPRSITAATGMDAFVHSLESFISTKANPISDAFALESMRLIADSIVEAYQHRIPYGHGAICCSVRCMAAWP